jgi:hypothetical protein
MKILRIILFCLVLPNVAFAHGDEDHSQDGAKGAGTTVGSAQPRLEVVTETFELVGQLHAQQLALFIDRFDTNEPVLGATVEVELNGAKAQAKYRADQGDYLVDDKALISALGKPGKHPLVFTVSAGSDSDLLEGTMQVAGEAHSSSHSTASHFSLSTSTVLAALLAVVVAIGAVVAIRRKNSPRK